MENGKILKQSKEDNCKMFIGGLSWETDEARLKKYFEKYGRVKDVDIKRDFETNRSRGFGFVLFEKPHHVDRVLRKCPHELDGKKIDPKKANPLGQDPKNTSGEDNKLFIGGIKPDTKEKTLREYFGQFGSIIKYERPSDHATGKSRGFCFISFNSPVGVKATLSAGQFHYVDGSRCECKGGVARSKLETKSIQVAAAADVSYQSGYGGYGDSSGYGGYATGYGGYTAVSGYQATSTDGYGGYGSSTAVPTKVNTPAAPTNPTTAQSNAGYDESLYTGYGGYGGSLDGYGGYTDQEQSYSNTVGGKTKSSMKSNKISYNPYWYTKNSFIKSSKRSM